MVKIFNSIPRANTQWQILHTSYGQGTMMNTAEHPKLKNTKLCLQEAINWQGRYNTYANNDVKQGIM